jgi:hypothetical protein
MNFEFRVLGADLASVIVYPSHLVEILARSFAEWYDLLPTARYSVQPWLAE